MKVLVTVLLTALFVFALATTWVDFVQPQIEQIARTAAQKAAPVVETQPSKRRRKVLEAVESELLPVPAQKSPTPLAESPKQASDEKPGESESTLLSQKLAEVKRQEADLAAREEALRMIYDDIRTELATVDQIRKRANADLAEAERRILETAQYSPQQAPKTTRTTRNSPVAPRTAGQTPAIRAEAMFIRHLVDQGKMETAVSVLRSMKGRDAASVLMAISSIDAKLADKLTARVQVDMSETVRR